VDEDDDAMLGEATWLSDIELLELASCVDDDEALAVIVCEVDSEGDCDGDAVTSCDGVDVSESSKLKVLKRASMNPTLWMMTTALSSR
jgi:hypothetical protein